MQSRRAARPGDRLRGEGMRPSSGTTGLTGEMAGGVGCSLDELRQVLGGGGARNDRDVAPLVEHPRQRGGDVPSELAGVQRPARHVRDPLVPAEIKERIVLVLQTEPTLDDVDSREVRHPAHVRRRYIG